jgi:hypothetical protein
MSKLALIGLVAGAAVVATSPARAYSIFGAPLDTAPWCVVYDIGAGVVRENCTMPSFQACNAERAIQGSTAFCRQNPAFAGFYADPGAPPRKRVRKHR